MTIIIILQLIFSLYLRVIYFIEISKPHSDYLEAITNRVEDSYKNKSCEEFKALERIRNYHYSEISCP